MTVLQPSISPSRWRVPPLMGFVLGAAACVVVAGIAVGEGGTTRDAALALGVVGIVAPIAWIAVRPPRGARLGRRILALLLLSTLVWRIRDAVARDEPGGYRWCLPPRVRRARGTARRVRDARGRRTRSES